MATMEQERELIFAFLNSIGGVVSPRKPLPLVGRHIKFIVVAIFTVDEEEWVL